MIIGMVMTPISLLKVKSNDFLIPVAIEYILNVRDESLDLS